MKNYVPQLRVTPRNKNDVTVHRYPVHSDDFVLF